MKRKKEPLCFACKVQGYSHQRTGKVCQDDAGALRLRSNAKRLGAWVAVVSDGHGGDRYVRSERGSRFAVEAAIGALKDFLESIGRGRSLERMKSAAAQDVMPQLCQNIYYRWQERVKEDIQKHPFTSEEKDLLKMGDDKDKDSLKAYGATLIAALVCPGHFWLALQIGDGRCIIQQADGTFKQAIELDERCFLNVTTSLCDEKPLERFHYCFSSTDFPRAVFLASDGVDDSFANDTDMFGFYQEILRTFRWRSGKKLEKEKEEIRDFLPILSQKGSGDDISVAGIILENKEILRYPF
ncbi:MAG: protein phosphatase 2C domain-containing protein [Bacteroidetes bacterium]|uniref:Protein phosphatase 2C domain-containing protein n=1 Tax=Candidatus Pullibacteroides excrementavium TaxID=2840905 RepID=A0A9D9DV56_9BACT|nr:protein phosphatase 2C domain-containing protein [Candidatus Pullibacteroides excrementavium]